MRLPAILLVVTCAASTAGADPVAGEARPEAQLDLGLSVIGVAYEQPVAERLALQVEADITSTYFAPWFSAGARVDGYAAGLRGSWFARPGNSGLYVAPYVRVARVTTDGVAGAGVGVSGGAFVGWAWRVTAHIDVRVGAGAQYYDYRVHGTGVASPFVALDGVVGYRL